MKVQYNIPWNILWEIQYLGTIFHGTWNTEHPMEQGPFHETYHETCNILWKKYGTFNETQNEELSLEHRTWTLEYGALNMELGRWNLEHGTWNMELGTWKM